jgi:hypothetical protein
LIEVQRVTDDGSTQAVKVQVLDFQEHLFRVVGGPKFEGSLEKAYAIGSACVEVRVKRGSGRATLLVPVALPYNEEAQALSGKVDKQRQDIHAWFTGHTSEELAAHQLAPTPEQLPHVTRLVFAAAECAHSLGVADGSVFSRAVCNHSLLRTITTRSNLSVLAAAAFTATSAATGQRAAGVPASVQCLKPTIQGLKRADKVKVLDAAASLASVDAALCWWRRERGMPDGLRVSAGDPGIRTLRAQQVFEFFFAPVEGSGTASGGGGALRELALALAAAAAAAAAAALPRPRGMTLTTAPAAL